jgi:hypothetical protein
VWVQVPTFKQKFDILSSDVGLKTSNSFDTAHFLVMIGGLSEKLPFMSSLEVYWAPISYDHMYIIWAEAFDVQLSLDLQQECAVLVPLYKWMETTWATTSFSFLRIPSSASCFLLLQSDQLYLVDYCVYYCYQTNPHVCQLKLKLINMPKLELKPSNFLAEGNYTPNHLHLENPEAF